MAVVGDWDANAVSALQSSQLVRNSDAYGICVGYVDSNWDVASRAGHIFMSYQTPVCWNTGLLKSTALSSCEAEIMAGSDAAKEAIYLNRFLGEVGLSDSAPVPLRIDNQGARDLSYNPELHQRTKHIDRRHFFIREAVERMQISVPLVATADNLADFFTKPLPAKRFFALRDVIMNVPSESRWSKHSGPALTEDA